jgi:arsenite methyltransferase
MSGGKCPFHHDDADDEPVSSGSAVSANHRAAEASSNWKNANKEELKQHFARAYDAVGRDAEGKRGQVEHAAILMTKLGYTKEELAVVGDDVWMMQGTGNPHAAAKIAPGECVLDLGSGFGIDALIAAAKVGPTGRVLGVDMSPVELTAAIKKISERRVRNVDFRLGDIEDLPVADSTVDVAISNGGFCLVPDKRKGLAEVFRVLRPGGRLAISFTTRKVELDPSQEWPSCITVFMPLSEVAGTLAEVGFTNVAVDTSNSRVDVWDEVEEGCPYHKESDVEAPIHKTGDSKYAFLESLDMNSICARVVATATKPI